MSGLEVSEHAFNSNDSSSISISPDVNLLFLSYQLWNNFITRVRRANEEENLFSGFSRLARRRRRAVSPIDNGFMKC